MEAIYFGCGDLSPPLKCSPADPSGGPYVLADMEHMRGMMAGSLPPTPITPRDFVVAVVKGKAGHLAIKAGDAQQQHSLRAVYDGKRPAGYEKMKKEGAIVLGVVNIASAAFRHLFGLPLTSEGALCRRAVTTRLGALACFSRGRSPKDTRAMPQTKR